MFRGKIIQNTQKCVHFCVFFAFFTHIINILFIFGGTSTFGCLPIPDPDPVSTICDLKFGCFILLSISHNLSLCGSLRHERLRYQVQIPVPAFIRAYRLVVLIVSFPVSNICHFLYHSELVIIFKQEYRNRKKLVPSVIAKVKRQV